MKAVTDTSREALKAIAPTLTTRERHVYRALDRYREEAGQWPTAYEVFLVMKDRREANDLNDVRPRLTYLCDKGFVEAGEKRRCTVTKKRVFTWRLVQRRLF